ncbi:MAG TPA: DUF58 domain-containing protein [Acidimicrobiales bacterium]|nr:DUF58 domain-containing protein [Acidimicrobiales bacterium]
MSRGASAGLTTRGWSLLVAAAVGALCAYLVGVEELYPLSLAAVVVVTAARLWAASGGPRAVEVSRRVHPERVPAGAEARVELVVANQGRRTTPPLEAADCFDGGRRWARFAIAPLAPGETRRASYRLPTSRRGIFRLGPLELHATDPMGLAHRTTVVASKTSVTVHPRFSVVPVQGTSSHRDADLRQPLPIMSRGSTEFYALRGYVPGDDLRHVHWPSTARLDDLVVRQPENVRWGRITVAADARASLHAGDSIEEVLSATASIAVSSLRAGLEVRVVTSDGFDSGHGSGAAHGPHILDGLAAAEAHGGLSPTPFRAAGGEPVVVVTTDRCAPSDFEPLIGGGAGRGATAVVFETPGGPPRGGLLPCTTVRVPLGVPFTTAWSEAAARC